METWLRGAVLVGLLLAGMIPAARALDPQKSISQFNVQGWTRQHGLPANAITSIAQSTDGYLWLGTAQGLVRFDGSQFKLIPVEFPGARGRDVRALVRAQQGGVWLVVNHGGYARFDGRTFTPLADSRWEDPAVTGKTVFEARDGALWTGSNLGVGRWVERNPDRSFVDGVVERVFAMVEDSRGRMWLGTEERGLFIYDGREARAVSDPQLQEETIFAVAAGPDDRIWVGTQHTLRCYDAEGRRVELPALNSGVNALWVDRHGVVWIGTADRGLIRYQDGRYTALGASDGLGSETVTALHEDAEGSLWVGTREGLVQLTDLKFPMVTVRDGIVGGAAHTVSPARGGGVWISTAGGLSHFQAGRSRNFRVPQLENAFVKVALETRNGDVYFFDANKVLNVLRGDAIVRQVPSRSWVEAMAEDDQGVLAALGSRLFRVTEDGFVPYEFEGVNPSFGYIDNLLVARDGSIWVAGYDGLFRVTGKTFQKWDDRNGLAGLRVRALWEDAEGTIWAALDTGLARVKAGRATSIRAENGLADDRLYALVEDDFGYLWIDSSAGIFRVRIEALNAFADGAESRVTSELFDGLESVKSFERVDQEFSACRSLDGRLWFPTSRGVVTINPQEFFVNRVPPKVVIERVRAGTNEVTGGSGGAFVAGEDRVEFSFSVLTFIAPRKAKVRYFLEGFDLDWVEAGERRSVTYQLRPGRYTFRVQAANESGVWSEAPAEYAFELPPSFYDTVGFKIICGLGGVLMLGAGYAGRIAAWKRRQRQLQAENDLLEAKVAERTNQLASSLSLLRATLDSTPDGILAFRDEGRTFVSNERFATMWQLSSEEVQRSTAWELAEHNARHMPDPAQFLARIREMIATPERESYDLLELVDGRTFERTCKPQRVDGRTVGMVINFHDVTQRRKAEAELEKMNRQLRETFRQAGMAEVATSVLHNVGNVLNSVNVSATIVAEKVRESKISHVTRLRDLLREHEGNLADFLTRDPRGRQLPEFLAVLAEHLRTEQAEIEREVQSLGKNIEHIKDIVAMQQSYAKVAGVPETVVVTDLIEDAVRMDLGSSKCPAVELVRDFQAEPVITTERHKVLQILINLLRNAKLACEESGRTDKRITIRVTASRTNVEIAVIDNGVGIPAENLTRIFGHGFTTRKDGHGFGLHSGALAAKEMGGALKAASEGAGHGATFVLVLPAGADASVAPERLTR